MKNKKIAIFDLDNTVLELDSDYEMVNYLIDNNYLNRKYRKKNEEYFNEYENGSLNINEFSRFSLKPFVGLSMSEINIILEDFYNQVLSSKFNNVILSYINKHRQKQDFVILASATNSLIVSYVARKLLIDKFVSSEVLFKDKVCTGNIKKPFALGIGKLELVSVFMAKNNFKFENAYFYSDSINDDPLLSKVAYPIAVNPDANLEKKCLKKDWKIIKT